MENPVHYLHMYFFMAYYVGAVPFRLKRDSETGLMELHENRFQKVICGLIHGYGLYQFIPSLLVIQLFNVENNSIAVFDLSAICAGVGYQISLIHALWFRRQTFLDICDQVHGDEILVARIGGKRKIQVAMSILGLVFTFLAVFYIFMGCGILKSWDWSPHGVFSGYANRTRLMLIWDTKGVPLEEVITPLNIVLTTIYLVLKTLSRIQFHFSDLSILMFALMIHHLARDFVTHMETGGVSTGISFEKLHGHFVAVKSLVDSMNKVYGSVFMWWIFESMPYYAGHFDEIFRNEDPLQKVRHGLYFVNYVCILLIAADGHCKIGQFKDWLSDEDNYSGVDVGHLTVLLNELAQHSIGINGKDFLTIHYDFFAAMISLILTYAIIVVEFRSGGASFSSYNNIL